MKMIFENPGAASLEVTPTFLLSALKNSVLKEINRME